MTDRTLDVDRYLVAAAIVATCALFVPASLDPVNIVKLSALLVAAVALLVSIATRVLRDRIVRVPVGPAGIVVALLVVALIISTIAAPVTHTAIYGAYGRNSGLLAYLAAIVLLVVGLRVFDRPGARVLVGGVVAAALFTATYGLLQKAGIDSIPWNNPFNPIIAGLGNPNFASGYLGVGASVAAGGALWAGWSWFWRGACALTCGLCLLAALLSNSVQGPIAAAGGLFVVAVAVVLNQRSRVRVIGLAVLGGAAALGVAVLLLGALAQAGPAGSIFSDNGSIARRFYWSAALTMFGDKPVFGVGLDQYGNFWRTARPADSLPFLGGPSFSDAAHSVPLQFLAQGGVVLGVAYLALFALTAFALVRGLLRLSGPDRILLAAVGAGWTAYQVQSFVSIDQVPLIVLHFALAGGVLALGGLAGLREFRLPGALEPVKVHANDAKARRRAASVAVQRRRAFSGVDLAVLGVVGVLGLVAAWQAFVPLRADMAAKSADTALNTQQGNDALTALNRSIDLDSGQSRYWIKKGQLFQNASPPLPEMAEQAFLDAAKADPYEVNAIRVAAALAETNGDLDQARRLFQRAADLDPFNSETVVGAATFELRHGGAEAARLILERALQPVGTSPPEDVTAGVRPEVGALWATLGDARAVLGDTAGARDAYDRALVFDPAQEVATQGIRKLVV